MKILDCETRETTYTSLVNILGVDRCCIDKAFEEFDIDKYYENNPYPSIEPDELVFGRVSSKPPSAYAFDRVCWFHLTRVPKSNTFLTKGILSLNRAIDSIWGFLYSLIDNKVSEKEWSDFRRRLVDLNHDSAHLYKMKVNNHSAGGPYAILVREIAFKSEQVGSHDYLRVPEIVEDICLCFRDQYGVDLLAAYKANSNPCIVKFAHDEPRSDCVTVALYYLYNCYYKNDLSWKCNTCFDNLGRPVPPKRILKVEWL